MEFIKDNFGYIVGFLTAPFIRLFFKILKKTIKSTKHKNVAKKDNNDASDK